MANPTQHEERMYRRFRADLGASDKDAVRAIVGMRALEKRGWDYTWVDDFDEETGEKINLVILYEDDPNIHRALTEEEILDREIARNWEHTFSSVGQVYEAAILAYYEELRAVPPAARRSNSVMERAWFSAPHGWALDRGTRDWDDYGWETLDMSGTSARWRKGLRTIEIFPNDVYTQFGPLEVRVDGFPWKDRFYDTPQEALASLEELLTPNENVSRRKNERTPLDNMAWHSDTLVRDIGGAVDDRDGVNPADVAQSVMEVWEQYDRGFEEAVANKYMDREEAGDAIYLADAIVDWANYGMAYGEYGNPPWRDNAYGMNPETPDSRRLEVRRRR